MIPCIDMELMKAVFKRVDAREKTDKNWVDYHDAHILLLENKHAFFI